jgi:hypothetical protein
MASGALARAQSAANIARAKIRQLESPFQASKGALVTGAGAFTAGFVDTYVDEKMPDMSFKLSPLVGVAGVVAGIAMNQPYLVDYAGGMLMPLLHEIGQNTAKNIFAPPAP